MNDKRLVEHIGDYAPLLEAIADRRDVRAAGSSLRSNGPDGATLIAVVAVIMRPGRDMPPRREVMAALIHDPGLVDQLGLVSDVAAVAGFAVENERLHAQARAHLIETEVSRPDNMDKGEQTNQKDIERGDRRV